MAQQDAPDRLIPLDALPSFAHERLRLQDARRYRKISLEAVLEHASHFGRPDFASIVPSPLKQPGWSQESVLTPKNSPEGRHSSHEDDDDEPFVFHLDDVEALSDAVWSSWSDGREYDPANVIEASVSPLQLLSEASGPDFTNTANASFTPQDPIGSPPREPAATTSWEDVPPLGAGADPPTTASNYDDTRESIDAASETFELNRYFGYGIFRPAAPAPEGISEDLSWVLQHLPQGSGEEEHVDSSDSG